MEEEKNKDLEQASLSVGGMSCAACVVRVEKALGGLEGVEKAAVNFATEKAQVTYDPKRVEPGKIQAGHRGGRLPVSGSGPGRAGTRSRKSAERIKPAQKKIGLQHYLGRGDYGPLHAPLHSLFKGCSHQILFYLLFVLTTPVQFWAGRQFLTGAWGAARHGSADMNTLIAVGTLSAYLYSSMATFAPAFFHQSGLIPTVYLDSAAMIIALILLGRLLEARAKGQTSEAIRKLMGLAPKTARVVREGQKADVPIEVVQKGDLSPGQTRGKDPRGRPDPGRPFGRR